MYPPPDLSREKRGMVWIEIKVLQENMMNSTKSRRELEWVPNWGKIDGIHHYNYYKITSDQHHLSSNIPDIFFFNFKYTWKFYLKTNFFYFLHAIVVELADADRYAAPLLFHYVPFPSVRYLLQFRSTFVTVSSNIYQHPFVRLAPSIHRCLFVTVHPRRHTIFFKLYVLCTYVSNIVFLKSYVLHTYISNIVFFKSYVRSTYVSNIILFKSNVLRTYVFDIIFFKSYVVLKLYS